MTEVPSGLLAIEVSSPLGSVAVSGGGGEVHTEWLLDPRAHASAIIPAIGSVLERAGVSRRDLQGIVVGRGPGSFTGVRVGAATARGLSMALELPVWVRSSLAAAACSGGVRLPAQESVGRDQVAPPEGGDPSPLQVLFDARGDRLYAATFRLDEGRLWTITPPHATTVSEVLASAVGGDAILTGSGVRAHEAVWREARVTTAPPPLGVPTAPGLLRLQSLDPQVEPEPPGSRWEPEYLRGSWGKPARGTQASAGKGGSG